MKASGLACALLLGVGGLPATGIAQSTPPNDANGAQLPVRSSPPAGPKEPEGIPGIVPEPGFITRGIDYATRTIGDGSGMKNGPYLEMSNMVTGAGWISVGPGYRHRLFGDRAIAEASAAYSWRAYKMAQARFELTTLAASRLVVGSQVRWQDLTQVTFFGEGPDSAELDRSEYRMTSSNVVGYATAKPRPWLAVTGRLGWLGRPRLGDPAGSFKRGSPSAQEVFPRDIVFTLAEQPSYIHGEASVTADTRDHRSYPSHGGVYRTAWTRYSDRDAGTFTFDRYEAEAAQFVPVATGRVVFAFHGWLVGSRTAAGHAVPFYLEPSFGGHNTMRGGTDYRFHDRNVLQVTAESRLALMTHVDVALFADAGNVGPRVADLDLAKRAYGIGIRVHSERATFARFDVAHGADGWRFLFRRNDPFELARLLRRTAAAPFAP
jgi:hypothetical protein